MNSTDRITDAMADETNSNAMRQAMWQALGHNSEKFCSVLPESEVVEYVSMVNGN